MSTASRIPAKTQTAESFDDGSPITDDSGTSLDEAGESVNVDEADIPY